MCVCVQCMSLCLCERVHNCGVFFLICNIYLRRCIFFSVRFFLCSHPENSVFLLSNDFFSFSSAHQWLFSGVRFHSFADFSPSKTNSFWISFGCVQCCLKNMLSVYLGENVKASSKSNLLKRWIMFAELRFYLILGLVVWCYLFCTMLAAWMWFVCETISFWLHLSPSVCICRLLAFHSLHNRNTFLVFAVDLLSTVLALLPICSLHTYVSS